MKKRLLFSFFLSLVICVQVWAQVTVSGKVTSSEDSSPLPGVAVVVKGTSTGTTTDVDGNYKISVPAGASLIFSYVGFKTTEMAVGTQSTINITLVMDDQVLSEVIVTAMGLEKDRKGLGYSLKEVKNDELTVARTTNVVNALAGKIAGVRVAGTNGMVGSSSAVFIRGFTTFTGSNQPLFVIDGIPINNDGGSNASQSGVSQSNRAIDINQDDIETMTVLKGPAAAVLYGSRAASGAIIITTKKGKQNQKNTIQYSGSYNLNEVNRFPDWQNEFAQGTSLSGAGVPISPVFQPNQDQSNWGPRIDGSPVASPYTAADQALFGLPATVPLTAYPDNVRNLFRTGQNIQNNIAFTGGSEKSSYYVSYNQLKDVGYLEGNELDRHSFRATVSSYLTKKLNVGVTANYTTRMSTRTQIGNQLSNPLFRGWFTPRNVDLQGAPWQRPDGSQVFYAAATDNPYWSLNNNLYSDRVNRFIGNVSLSYDALDWLNISYKLGADLFTEVRKTVDGIGARGGANHQVGGVGAIGDRTIYNQEINSYLNITAKKKINDDLTLSFLLGNEINTLFNNDQGIVGNTLVTRGYFNISNATNFVPFGDQFKRRLFGIYGDIQVNYKNWLFLNLTGRQDWSSTFKAGNNSYFYPSANVSAVLTEMIPALQNNSILSFAKIKANYANVGRQAPVYGTDTYFSNANPSDGFGPNLIFPFRSLQGRTLNNQAGNAALGPEFTQSIEVGTEVKLLKNRLGIDFTYFQTKSTDIILAVPIAGASGYTSQLRNSGTMESSGFELSVDFAAISKKDFTWNISANWTRIRNMVLSLAPGVQNISLGPFTTAESRIVAGKPYGTIYANTLLRNDQGKLVINNLGLPIIDTRGVQEVGDPNPNWTAGITNTLTYKGLTLNFLIDIRSGGDLLSRNINDLRRTGSVKETTEFPRFDANGQPTRPYVIDGVLGDGTPNTTAITAQQYWGNLYSFNVPGMGVFDASWIRLREVSVSYRLPKTILDKTFFGSAEIGLNGRNLWLRTNVPHIDPETTIGTNNGNTQGVEFNALPGLRSYGFFLKFTL